jgi:hypothetical protein
VRARGRGQGGRGSVGRACVCMRMIVQSVHEQREDGRAHLWARGREGGRLGECVAGSTKVVMGGTCGDSVGLDSCTTLLFSCLSCCF